MIRGDQLMIGDFVLVDGMPRQIQAITKKKIGYHRKENEPRLYYAKLHDVEPIELTKELLWEIGFWKEPNNDKIFSCAGNIDNVYSWDASHIMGTQPKIRISSYVTIDKIVESSSCCVHAKYLHELQHAFRLCGVNLEVKL